MSDSFDLIVIGAGPGGYVCAIRAAQLGKKVAIVEKRGTDGTAGKPLLGGTCLNVGCIPSKALLDSSEHFFNAREHFADHGIAVGKPKIDVAQMMKRKTKVVDELVGGIDYLMKKNKITVLAGTGRISGSGAVDVTDAEGATTTYQTTGTVLAMGSVPIELPFLPYSEERIVNSDHAIAFDEVPKKLIVVGGGVIGLELGSVWARLGSEVHVVEFMPQIVPGYEKRTAAMLQKALSKQGLQFHLQTKVTGYKSTKTKITLEAEDKSGEAISFSGDRVLVCVGRRPNIDANALKDAGIACTERGRIQVDDRLQTSLPNVYAIGDCIDGPMLAHKAEEDGVAVAETIAGQHGHVDWNLVPGVVYTEPELASIGITAEQAKEQGRKVRIGKFNVAANGRAKASGITDGFVQLVADDETDEVLGVTILGARASDLIAECGAVMAFSGSAEDIARICHAHPTFAESIKEAALDACGRLIHG